MTYKITDKTTARYPMNEEGISVQESGLDICDPTPKEWGFFIGKILVKY